MQRIEEIHKIASTKIGVPFGFRNEHFPKTSQRHYSYSNFSQINRIELTEFWLINLHYLYEIILYRICGNFEINPVATAIVTSLKEGFFKALRFLERIRASRHAINSQVNQFEGRRKSHSAGCDCKKEIIVCNHLQSGLPFMECYFLFV